MISITRVPQAGCLISLIPLSIQRLYTAQIVKNDSQTVAAFKLYTIKGSQEIIICCTKHKINRGFRVCFRHKACLSIVDNVVDLCENIYYL